MRKIRFRKWNSYKNKSKYFGLFDLGVEAYKANVDDEKAIFWIGETNFDIGQNEASIIDMTPGISVVTIFDAYTFRIKIGSQFPTKKTLSLLRFRLCGTREDINKDIIRQVRKIKLDLVGNGYWLVYAMPNNKIKVFQEKDVSKFREQYEKFEFAKKEIGGHLFSGV